jgi:hypothetical protein
MANGKRMMRNRPRGWGVRLTVVTLTVAGCDGGLHRQGDWQLAVTGSYGHPIRGQALWPDGDGRADNGAGTVGLNYFARDRLAVLSGLTPCRIYNQSDGNVYAGEIQLGARYYFWEFHIGPVPVGLYGELLGGISYSARSVPEEGSNFNFTQDAGMGFEMILVDGVSLIGGYRLKHLSNADLFNDANPSQNDNHVYGGIAIALKPWGQRKPPADHERTTTQPAG